MSGRGSFGRGGRGSDRGRGGGFGGRGGGGRGGFQRYDQGPPETVLELGSFVHAVEDEMLCSSLIPDKVPHFNAPIYLQNKSQIGKVDEILGPVNEVYFSVKMEQGMVAASFKKGDKVLLAEKSRNEAEVAVVLAAPDEVHQVDEVSPEVEVGVCAAEVGEAVREVHRAVEVGLVEVGLVEEQEVADAAVAACNKTLGNTSCFITLDSNLSSGVYANPNEQLL